MTTVKENMQAAWRAIELLDVYTHEPTYIDLMATQFSVSVNIDANTFAALFGEPKDPASDRHREVTAHGVRFATVGWDRETKKRSQG